MQQKEHEWTPTGLILSFRHQWEAGGGRKDLEWTVEMTPEGVWLIQGWTPNKYPQGSYPEAIYLAAPKHLNEQLKRALARLTAP